VQSIAAHGLARTLPPPHASSRRRFARAGIVLPRILRRPARMLEKIDWKPPRYAGAASVMVLFAATLIAGVIAGGHATTVVAAVTAWSGLAIDEIRITGQSRTAELDVLRRLEIGQFPSLVTFDLDAAKARLETLPWVADAALRKLYPHDLNVVIRERRPFAVWQDGDRLWLIDDTGHAITDAVDDRYASLPMVVGKGAARRIGDFVALVRSAPAIAERTRAGVLIGERRWTLVLDNGVEVMLPEQEPGAALAAVARLDAESALLSRAITAVDLREPARLVVRLDAEAAAARLHKGRAATVKART
jgi:cell division protein FtsQ